MRLAAISPTVREEALARHPGADIEVIHNSIDFEAVSRRPDTPAFGDTLRIVQLGRLFPESRGRTSSSAPSASLPAKASATSAPSLSATAPGDSSSKSSPATKGCFHKYHSPGAFPAATPTVALPLTI